MPELQTKSDLMVDFEPIGRRAEIPQGSNLLEAAQAIGVDLISICGGFGICDSCRVRLVSGELSPVTIVEQGVFTGDELKAGYRLACRSKPQSNVKIEVPPESLATTQRLQVEGQETPTTGANVLVWCDVHVKGPALDDLRSDATRLLNALSEAGYPRLRINPQVLQTISDVLRANDWQIRAAIRGEQLVGLVPAQTRLFGLAVDVGTTKVAGYLVDLDTRETLAKSGIMNPQISYGEDVISRIAYCDLHNDGRAVLQSKLVEALNSLTAELNRERHVSRNQLVEAVLVGNTAMHHLLAGLPVRQLAMAPYVPAVSDPLELPARDIGLKMAAGATVYLPPNIAGFVGADHVAMLLATEMWRTDKTSIALDIGTNTEITLAYGGRMLSCSCASGPAFEGAHITDGMRAAPGAIERVKIIDGEPNIFTIGGQAPVGICGSGILDAVAQLVQCGIVDEKGALGPESGRVRRGKDATYKEFLLVEGRATGHGRDIVVTRPDINEIQLAKGAIRAGIDILLREADIVADDIDEFIVAGAFGTYLDVESAVQIGMFPSLPRRCFRQVGNAAGAGARQMVVSADRRQAAEEIRRRVEYVELTTHPGFQKAFMASLYLRGHE
jgi:uncharacterized 2Fe-2S/4Fe-4S cluster protein (DUF4445 family)